MIQTSFSQAYFNPRPPRGGRRKGRFTYIAYEVFQSTPSARRATWDGVQFWLGGNDFNPRPPRGGRPFPNCQGKNLDTFQSTPSARRATNVTLGFVEHLNISIHALREEGDRSGQDTSAPPEYFNPRPPRGGRRGYAPSGRYCSKFQSTPSARRATCPFCQRLECLKISIHALREESDNASLLIKLKTFSISIHALREESDPLA